MLIRSIALGAGALAIGLWALPSPSVQALTLKECSEKYRAAQAAGAKDLKWNDFRKAQCGATATAAPAGAAPGTAAPNTTPTPAQSAPKRAERPARPPTTTGVGSPGDAAFPTAVSPKYSSETAGKARMHTCLDQYNANKAANRNGGLNWIQKGGGYYSECNKRLKG
jgi:hypothetical protein